MYDEPFADSSQIPTYLVSAMTRRHVTVALSGDGGDELFAGYNRYQLAHALLARPVAAAAPLRGPLAAAMTRTVAGALDRLLGVIPSCRRLPQAGDKLHKLASVLRPDDPTRAVSAAGQPLGAGARSCRGVAEPQGRAVGRAASRATSRICSTRMQFLDLVTYLPDDILTKVDRASMAVALEARVPLLDHRVVEFAWRLPQRMKIRDGKGKWLLRQVLVPPRAAAIWSSGRRWASAFRSADWLRGPLRDWAERLLRRTAAARGGTARRIAGAAVLGRASRAATRNWQYLLWDVLMLEAWRERWA